MWQNWVKKLGMKQAREQNKSKVYAHVCVKLNHKNKFLLSKFPMLEVNPGELDALYVALLPKGISVAQVKQPIYRKEQCPQEMMKASFTSNQTSDHSRKPLTTVL